MRYGIATLVVLCACAASSPRSRSSTLTMAAFDQTLVPQLHHYAGESLYDVLARDRPLYLRPRTPRMTDLAPGQDLIGVVINGHYSGGLEALQGVSADVVYSVRRLSASEAVIRYGRHFVEGALEVTLSR
ncbi:MAG: hypothetical protein U0132_19255 [Gemmatimonadaceae bacterium]